MATWELKEKSVGDMIVKIEGEVWQKAVTKAFNKISKNVVIDGFRKGQAPKALLEKRIPAGERQIQAVEDNMNDWMREGLKELDLAPISQPSLDIRSIGADGAELVYTFAVMPEVKVSDYKGLPYELEAAEVTDEDVENEIERLRNQYAEWEESEEAAENGDTVNINYEGFKDGVAFDGGKADNYDLNLGSGSFIPGFEDQLVGVKAGEEKDLELSFPEDYHAEELAGAPVVFKVKVNTVKKKSVPEADDEFAADLSYKDVETLDDLKAFIRKDFTERKQKEAEAAADNKLFDKLYEKIEVDLPDVLVDEEVQAQINQLANQLQSYNMSLTSYLQMMNRTADQLKEDYRDNAVKSVALRLGLEKISELENLAPTEEDINKEFENLASQYNMEVDQLKTMIDPEMMKNDVKNQKAYEFIKNNAAKAE